MYRPHDNGVPEHTLEALNNYFKFGWEPGSFLMSVLCGDLYGAAGRADHMNTPSLAYIAKYIMNEAPYGSWGSVEAVRDWVNKGHYFQVYEKQRLVDILKA